MANYIEDPEKYHELTKIMYIDSYGDLDLIEVIKNINPNSILEVGCGTGYLTEKVINFFGGRIVATDVNQSFLDFAQRKIKNLKTFNFDAIKDKLSEPVELIYCRFVFHHIKNIDKVRFLENLKRNSKKIILLDYFIPKGNKIEALKKFHDYRSKLFQGNPELIRLDKETLELSLQGKEEHKISLDEFYFHLKKSDFKVVYHELITNFAIDDPSLFGLHLFVLEKEDKK